MDARILSKLKDKPAKTRVRPTTADEPVKELNAYDIAQSIKRGLAEVELIEEGKLKPKRIDDLLNEL